MQPDPDNSISGGDDGPSEAPSLREVAEAAYNDAESGVDSSADTGGPTRDSRGRFAAKDAAETGEAEPSKSPSPDQRTPDTQSKPAEPAPAGSSTRPTEHWSAEDRAAFSRMPQEAQDLFMRRYNEMEADYTRKTQANAGAVNAVNALTPIFNDPDIAASLREQEMHPMQAIHQWAGFHKRAVSQNPRDRAALLYELAERMGFDPARLFATARQPEPPVNLSEQDKQDPVYRYIADQFGRQTNDLQALRSELNTMREAERQKYEQSTLQVTRQGIDHYADEKGPDGKPLRPYFDRVVNHVIELYKANPQRDLNEAYERACWMDPDVRKEMLDAERNRQQAQVSNDRARQAVRGNTRGITSPVSKPTERKGNGSLRDVLEASADEVGY